MSATVAIVRHGKDWQAERRLFRMQAFHPSYRRNVVALSRQSGPLADLADSFPGFLFALATAHGTAVARATALRLLHEGAPLREAAGALGLPWWLRRLPPQAFGGPLGGFAASDSFHERIANLLPASPGDALSWLWVVDVGLNGCHEDFALWSAAWANRQPRTMLALLGEANFRHLAAWAWYSGQPHLQAFALMRRPWTAQMGPRRGLDELAVWRRRSRLATAIGPDIGDIWVSEGQALGFEFVALRTARDFVVESEAMDNCLDQFAERIEEGRSRVFSIRHEGRPVADVEIGLQEVGAGMPAVLQLRGPRNRRASPGIWQATYAWLGSQPLKLLVPCLNRRDDMDVRMAARAFWMPYLERLDVGLRREFRSLLAQETGITLGPAGRRRRKAEA